MNLNRREKGKVHTAKRLKDIIPHTSEETESWLWIVPHDDDAVIGGGLLLQQAAAEGKRVKIIITTDGSMGYCNAEQRNTIASIRRAETFESFGKLGIHDIEWLNYPDADLFGHLGRRKAKGDVHPDIIAGFSGLQNSFTAHMRSYRPSHVFVMSENDYNPDHKLVYQEALISLFHAQGAIWPELGEPLKNTPHVYEMAAYCNFRENPDIEMVATAKEFSAKLSAVDSFQSQKQIQLLVENLKENGPYEYLRDIGFDYYTPGQYRGLFHNGGEEIK